MEINKISRSLARLLRKTKIQINKIRNKKGEKAIGTKKILKQLKTL